jgi:glutathione synthase/RimK-type ligase-like ATP-grasp enzyme
VNRVAIATCRGENIDPDSPLLLDALAARDIGAELCVWDDEDVIWDNFDLVVIRSTWDYPARRGEFLRWARSFEHLLNPYGVVEYSSDKHYLADLESLGLAIIPSRFCDVGHEPDFFDVDFVVKPCVGAGSIDAVRYRAADLDAARAQVRALHASGHDVLIQPYVTSVDEVGERALIFINGSFSHAMTKGAMLNVAPDERDWLFRREQMSTASAEPDAVQFAERVLEAKGFGGLLYARVDLVRGEEDWEVMELELVEPSLFLTYEPAAAGRLADAIDQRLERVLRGV